MLILPVQQLLSGVVSQAEGIFELPQLRGPVVSSLDLPELAAHTPTDPVAALETETARAILGFLSMARDAAVLGKMRSPRAAHPEHFGDKTDQLPRGACVHLASVEDEQILDPLLDGSGQDGFDLFELCPGRDFPRAARAPSFWRHFDFR
jgi:hypothetical protein